MHIEDTIIWNVILKTRFSVIYTLPFESIYTGELDEEYIFPFESFI